jgi:hypothetical protein
MAEQALAAAKEHCKNANDLLADAEDMASIADKVIEDSSKALDLEADLDFETILEEIN